VKIRTIIRSTATKRRRSTKMFMIKKVYDVNGYIMTVDVIMLKDVNSRKLSNLMGLRMIVDSLENI